MAEKPKAMKMMTMASRKAEQPRRRRAVPERLQTNRQRYTEKLTIPTSQLTMAWTTHLKA